MKIGLLNICIDGLASNGVDKGLTAKLMENGLDVVWASNCTKHTFDYAYSMCSATPDGVILTGHTKQFLSFLKSRFGQDFRERVFGFDGIRYMVLPGYDYESIEDALQEFLPTKSKARIIKFGVFSKSSDQIKSVLADLMVNKSKIKFEFLSEDDSVVVVMRVPHRTEEIVVQDMLAKISARLQEFLYAANGKSMMEQVADALKKAGVKVAVAESYTAGGIAKSLCSVAGASAYFCEGMVCYSPYAKQKRLGVSPQTIQNFGVVSGDVAYEMAAGLLVQNPTYDLVLATTGYASTHTINGLDVTGQCFLAIGTRDAIHVFPQQFAGTRKEIVQKGIDNAIFKLYKMLT
ncbi:MAG: nicotinamide-nucleotide amidohydrolase family protein [Firmicutes bacterium]|nr:nicotinamide-nucleotide amidohydrolase family protein [Bacillota bacterium]